MTTSGGTPTSFSAWRSSFRRLAAAAGSAGEGIASLLYPRECVLCGRSLPERGVLCPSCVASLPSLPSHGCRTCGELLEDHSLDLCLSCGTRERGFDAVYALGPYEGGWDRLVHAFKFDREPAVGRWLGERLADVLAASGEYAGFEAVTYVPMTWHERRARTFNQAEILARTVSRRLGLPLCKLLIKTRRTRPQSRLSAPMRRANVRDAFRARRLGGGRILLVDDVCTTGATVEACAAALKRAGHDSVVVLTAARA